MSKINFKPNLGKTMSAIQNDTIKILVDNPHDFFRIRVTQGYECRKKPLERIMGAINPARVSVDAGLSGMGACHGFSGFEQFSHKKAILKSFPWQGFPMFYPAYRKELSFLKKIPA